MQTGHFTTMLVYAAAFMFVVLAVVFFVPSIEISRFHHEEELLPYVMGGRYLAFAVLAVFVVRHTPPKTLAMFALVLAGMGAIDMAIYFIAGKEWWLHLVAVVFGLIVAKLASMQVIEPGDAN